MRKWSATILAVSLMLLLAGCGRGTAVSVGINFWEEIWGFISAHWGKILIAIGALFFLYSYIVARHRKENQEKGEKAGLGKANAPKTLNLKSPATEGVIADAVAATLARVFTVKTMLGHGSGFLISGGGWAITNQHVVGDEEYVEVKFFKKENSEMARVVKIGEGEDVALLKVSGTTSGALPVSFAKPRIGNDVYVMGTPLNEEFAGTLTRGVVSQFREGHIQSDSTIHPGNSGGPLLDKRGNVIGVAVAGIDGKSGDTVGINFFIPIASALKSLNLPADESAKNAKK